MLLNISGDPAAPTLVLIHGIPGSAAIWDGVVTRLEPNHRVVVADLFALSTRTGDLRAEAQAAALDRALRERAIDRAVIAGHDFGGPIALSLYRRRPELFEGLALLATNAFPDTPIPFPLNGVNLPLIGNAIARVLFSGPALRQMLRRYDGSHLGDPVSVRKIFTQALQNLDELYRDYPDILAGVTVPVSVVWGDSDPFFAVKEGERIASLPADADLRVLSGAGHFLPEQRPEDVSDALAALAARVERVNG